MTEPYATEPQKIPRDLTLLNLRGVCAMVCFGKSSIYRKIESGDFPKPYNFGARTMRWLKVDVESWIASKLPAGR